MVGVFVSNAVWNAVGDRLLDADPGLQRIAFVAGERVTEADVARIEVGCLSPDLWPQYSASFMRICLDAPNLLWLHSASAGVDHRVFRMVIDGGARLTNSTGASARPIAHHVIMNLLAMRRDLPGFLRDQARHEWNMRDIGDVEGTTVGVVGLGPIGTEVARLAIEFGFRPIGVRRKLRGDEPCETWTFDRLHELLGMVDALVLALPLTADTRQLIGVRELALMPAGVHLVNVGRGELIDEAALIDALRSGHVGAAALDVTEVEPLPVESPLWDMANVIITPHSSGATASTRRRTAELFADNFARFVQGHPLVNEIA